MPHTLTDHETIRRWAEARGVRPSALARRENPDLADVDICLAVPGLDDEALEPIAWPEWFRKFDDADLALLIEDASRQPSTFNKLVRRNGAAGL